MKNIAIKIYSPQGEFLKEWKNGKLDGFTKEINSGLGECLITLGEKMDYQGIDLSLGNILDILVADKNTEGGYERVYSGYISMIEPIIDGYKEEVLVHALGHHTKLSLDILKNGSQIILYSNTTNGLSTSDPAEEADTGLIIRAIIERYRAETDNPIIYSTLSSIPLTTETAVYTIAMKTYRESLDSVASMLPAGYFWYLDQDGLFSIKSKGTTPTHYFQFGKHFKAIRIERSMEKIRNFLLIWNGETSGGVFKKYEDAYSIAQYGRRFDSIVDYGIDDTTSADKIGAKFIAENKNPSVKLVCEIIDNNIDDVNGYNVESINPGDTCRFIGFDSSLTDILEDNMLITKVDYFFDRVIIEVELRKSGVVNWQSKTASRVRDLASYNVPESYT
jgi:hypothetical protein